MKILFLLLILLPDLLFSQAFEIPYEFERYPVESYRPIMIEGPFQNERDAISAYLNSYKLQRAINPSEYFPKPNEVRLSAASFITKAFPKSASAAVIAFLESSGSRSSCERLLNGQFSEVFAQPYGFIAGFLLQSNVNQTYYLTAMRAAGMIHPVLLAFGQNALLGTNEVDGMITQGLQDLVAVKAAQLLEGVQPDILVYSRFSEKCSAFNGKKIRDLMVSPSANYRISLTMSKEFLTLHQDHLTLTGCGYLFDMSGAKGQEAMRSDLIYAAGHFHKGEGFTPPLNASIVGILQSYRPFLDTLEEISMDQDAKIYVRFGKDIREYIESTLSQ